MNYQKIYDSIIEISKSQNRVKLRKNQEGYIYYETHHIIPRCLGGSNDKENLVLLTAKEHFLCHKLLIHIFNNNYKLVYALHKLTYTKNGNHVTSGRDYSYIRSLLSTVVSGENHPSYGKKRSEESKQRMRKSHKSPSNEYKEELKIVRKGENNPMFGKKQSKESKEKNRQKHIGKKHTEESKKKMSNKRNGFKHSEETKKKQSKWQKGKTYEELYGSVKAAEMKEKQRQKKLQKNKG